MFARFLAIALLLAAGGRALSAVHSGFPVAITTGPLPQSVMIMPSLPFPDTSSVERA